MFERLASGRTVGQVAEELSLSVKTISTYRARILEKLSLESNADLTLYALRNAPQATVVASSRLERNMETHRLNRSISLQLGLKTVN